jgi:beta-mannosidase
LEIRNWKVTQYDKQEQIPAAVPGAVHYDLIASGKLDNPYAGTKQAFAAEWVAKTDWLYETAFDVPPDTLAAHTLILRFHGIDTFADISLNGKLIGKTANAYRAYDFTLDKTVLKPAGNTLAVRVKSHDRMIRDKAEGAKRMFCGDKVEGTFGKAFIRRYQRSFYAGSSLLNLGTGVLGIGIYRPVELIAHKAAYISDYHFRTDKIEGSKVCGTLFYKLEEAASAAVIVEIKDADGKTVFARETSESPVRVEIDEPKLWWPAGYGEPNLYTLNLIVLQNGEAVDQATDHIGLRTVELSRKTAGGRNDFRFKINGQAVYIHGQNHIPLDYIKVYRDEDEYDRLFALIQNQNVNMLRIWGGGVVERKSFYDRCDRFGIMIWHELFLHSNVYPDYDDDFVREFRTESEGILKAVRNHPALTLICGGNEQREGWDEWGWKGVHDRFYGEKLITEVLPPIAKALCPELPFIDNSPHGGETCQSPTIGETHNWGNFYNSTKDPLFVTETCWTTESYSRPETLAKWMGLDVDEYADKTWQERFKERTSLPFFNRMPYTNWFRPNSLRDYLHGLELEQMRADYSALSMFRYESPSNTGVIYWSLTKGGPLFQFGCVDYDGRPMMSYYAVKRVFAPIGVYPYRDVADMCVILSNHTNKDEDVTVTAKHFSAEGARLHETSVQVRAGAGETLRAVRMENMYVCVTDRLRETLYVAAYKNGELLSEDLFFFCPYGEYAGVYKPLGAQVKPLGEGKWRLALTTDVPVRSVEIESPHKLLLSDNYFPAVPGGVKEVDVTALQRIGGTPMKITVQALGCENAQTIALEP